MLLEKEANKSYLKACNKRVCAVLMAHRPMWGCSRKTCVGQVDSHAWERTSNQLSHEIEHTAGLLPQTVEHI